MERPNNLEVGDKFRMEADSDCVTNYDADMSKPAILREDDGSGCPLFTFTRLDGSTNSVYESFDSLEPWIDTGDVYKEDISKRVIEDKAVLESEVKELLGRLKLAKERMEQIDEVLQLLGVTE